jgi:hypothetical protein
MEEEDLEDKFPVKYRNQPDMARSALYGSMYYSTIDTIAYLDKMLVDDRKHKGWLYFYKYKRSKDDVEWRIAYSGLQPVDTTSFTTGFNSYENDFIAFSRQVYHPGDIKQQQQQLLKECLYSLRESASQFYGKYDDEDINAAAVEEVKGGRFE